MNINPTPEPQGEPQELVPCPWCGARGDEQDEWGYLVTHKPTCYWLNIHGDPIGRVRVNFSEVERWNTRHAAVPEPRPYFCSCGAACTAEEYITHYFEMGHDRGDPAFTGAAVAGPRGDALTIAEKVVEYLSGKHLDPETALMEVLPIAEVVAAATASPTGAERLDCPMCNAPKSFEIDVNDTALGHCYAEDKSWRVTDNKCITQGCFQPRATFGDLCMDHLREAVDAQ